MMQYFQAVQEGKRRASKSQMTLFNAAGFAMLTLTTKKVDGKFLPVGKEEYAAIIRADQGHVVILCDKDGFTKAQSKGLDHAEASDILKTLIQDDNIESFPGDTIMIWTQAYPVVRS